jgi:type IV/VI secretion system ImpK/VasF family protein
MADQVMKTARPVIDYLLSFRYRLEIGESIDLHTLRGDLLQALRNVEIQLSNIPMMPQKVDTIKYILTGFCDEVILSSEWSHARDWHERLLEMEFFKTSVVGERFFHYIEHEGYHDPEMAELFFTILTLGFRGRYRNNREELQIIKQRLYAVLPHRLPEDERHLSPGAEYVITGKQTHLPRLIGTGAVAGALLVSVICYTIASQWMWNDIVKVIHLVSLSLGGSN